MHISASVDSSVLRAPCGFPELLDLPDALLRQVLAALTDVDLLRLHATGHRIRPATHHAVHAALIARLPAAAIPATPAARHALCRRIVISRGNLARGTGQARPVVRAAAPVRGLAWCAAGPSILMRTEGGTLARCRLDARPARARAGAPPPPLRLEGAQAGAPVHGLACCPQGRWVAASVGMQVGLWRLDAPAAPPRILPGLAGEVRGLHFDADGTHLLTAPRSRSARLWSLDAAGAACIGTLEHPAAILFSALGGARAMTACAADTIRIQRTDGAGAPPLTLCPTQGGARSAALSAAGRFVAAGSFTGWVSLWDLAHGSAEQAFASHDGPVAHLAFARDEARMAAACDVGILAVWRLDGAVPRYRTVAGSRQRVGGLAFAPHVPVLAVAHAGGSLCLWDVAGPAPVPHWRHDGTGALSCLVFSSDGTRLITGSEDGTVLEWNFGGPTTPRRPKPHDGRGEP